MTKEAFRVRWQETSASGGPGLEELVAQYSEGWRDGVEGLRELAKSPAELGPRAAEEFARSEEAAIPALLAGLSNEGGADYRQLAQLGKLLMGLDGSVAGYLKRALGDRRVVPVSKGMQKAEGRRPGRRVCDEAYLGLRRLGSGETEITAQLEADEFLHLAEADRDAEMAQYLKVGKFSRFLPQGDGE